MNLRIQAPAALAGLFLVLSLAGCSDFLSGPGTLGGNRGAGDVALDPSGPPKEGWTVTFDSQLDGALRGEGPKAQVVLPPNRTLGKLPPAPWKYGYAFTGWYTAKANDPAKKAVRFDGTTVLTGDTTVYAYWMRDFRAACSDATGQRLAVVVSQGLIYTTEDGGANWKEQVLSGVRDWRSIACDSTGQYLAATVWEDGVYTSDDYGVHWTVRYPEEKGKWGPVASSRYGSFLVAAEMGGAVGTSGGSLWSSSDYGVTWTKLPPSPEKWLSVACSADGTNRVAAVAQDGAFVSSGDGWTVRDSNRKKWWGVASSADGSRLFACTADASLSSFGSLSSSSDYGVTWAEEGDLSGKSVRALACSGDGKRLVAAVYGSPLYFSSGSGFAPSAAKDSPANPSWISLAASADFGAVLAVELNGNVYLTTDQGQSIKACF